MTPDPSLPEPARRNALHRWAWPVAVAAMIFFASSRSKVAAPTGIDHIDKIAHFFVYGLLGTLIARGFFSSERKARAALWALLAGSLYGVSDEFHQSFTPGRSVEFGDWVADTLGAGIGAHLYVWWTAYRRVLETGFRARRRTASLTTPADGPELVKTRPPVNVNP